MDGSCAQNRTILVLITTLKSSTCIDFFGKSCFSRASYIIGEGDHEGTNGKSALFLNRQFIGILQDEVVAAIRQHTTGNVSTMVRAVHHRFQLFDQGSEALREVAYIAGVLLNNVQWFCILLVTEFM